MIYRAFVLGALVASVTCTSGANLLLLGTSTSAASPAPRRAMPFTLALAKQRMYLL